MHLNKLFYQPMWADMLSEIDNNHLEQIKEFCIGQSLLSTGRIFSNKGGWQSNDYSYSDLKNTPLEFLLQVIMKELHGCMGELDSTLPLEFESIWININKKEDSNSVHTHSGVLSGSFYVTVPDPAANIFFTREYDLHQWFYGSIGSHNRTEAPSPRTYIKPIDKLLLVFPSWMPHGVQPNPSDENRISISFNTQLKSNIN